ncbi:MAG: hypothetical protein AAF627_09320 [Myxococcota bacterium]
MAAEEIDSALDGAFAEAVSEPTYDPFAPSGEEDAEDLPPLELTLPEPEPAPARSQEASLRASAASPAFAPSAPASVAAPTPELGEAWRRAAEGLDDPAAQQRFLQACLVAQQLPFAVACYRSLAEAPRPDPRAAAQLKKVGALLGFHAPAVQLADDTMSPRLQAMVAGIILAAVAIAGAAWWFG